MYNAEISSPSIVWDLQLFMDLGISVPSKERVRSEIWKLYVNLTFARTEAVFFGRIVFLFLLL